MVNCKFKSICISLIFLISIIGCTSCNIFRNEVKTEMTHENGKLVSIETKIINGNKTVHILQKFNEKGVLIHSDTTTGTIKKSE